MKRREDSSEEQRESVSPAIPEDIPGLLELYQTIENVATEFVKLRKADIHEIQASVIADYRALFEPKSDLDPLVVSTQEELRKAWVTKRVAAAYRKLARRRVSRPEQRTVELAFDPADTHHTIAIDLSESQTTIEGVEAMMNFELFAQGLSPRDLRFLFALLEGYARDLTNKEVAELLHMPTSTFNLRKKALLTRAERALGHSKS